MSRERESRRPARLDDPLEQRLDRWVATGRQLVEGVSGARPGARQPGRGADRRTGGRARVGGLGRWVEDKLDWFLEEEEDWREPWQQASAPDGSDDAAAPSRMAQRSRPRRALEAISRRGQLAAPGPAGAPGATADPVESGWPSDDDFTVPRWQRQSGSGRGEDDTPPPPAGARPLPRSSRRR